MNKTRAEPRHRLDDGFMKWCKQIVTKNRREGENQSARPDTLKKDIRTDSDTIKKTTHLDT